MVNTVGIIDPPRKPWSARKTIIDGLASLAPTLGPVIGGWITETWSWHWLFYINLVPGVVVTVLVPLLVKIDKPDLSLLKGADYLGIALMAAFLGCLEYVLEEGPRWDWFGDDTIRTCAWISAIAGIGFVARSLTFTRPVVDLRALAIRNFSLGRLNKPLADFSRSGGRMPSVNVTVGATENCCAKPRRACVRSSSRQPQSCGTQVNCHIETPKQTRPNIISQRKSMRFDTIP